MASFSERKGLVAAKGLQTDSLDGPLRNRLWTVFYEILFTWVRHEAGYHVGSSQADKAGNVRAILPGVWLNFFDEASDTCPADTIIVQRMRDLFMSDEWHKVYSLIEFLLAKAPYWAANALSSGINAALERENAAYRIVGKIVSDITSPEEIAEIEDALATKIGVVRMHLTTALEHLSNRENPDPRNSIKESISAVESICRLVAGGQTLDDALKTLGEKVPIHPALNKAFRTLYGYTSDQVRHGLLKEGNVGATEARFMLVACSAFINYVLAHAAESGIELG